MGTRYKFQKHHPCIKDITKTDSARKSGFGWSSGNWSGYAISGKKGAYHSISAEWVVPFIKPSSQSTYSSAWIGIDGFKNSSLIQTGTGHEFVNGTASYYAWWEILPEAETVIPLPVKPGDRIKATIVKVSRTKWTITLRNLSQKWIFRTLQSYTGPQTSAEWIMEAPQVGNTIAKLTRMSPTCFNSCRVNGRCPKLTASAGGIMIQNNIAVAVPSCPNSIGNAFKVKRVYSKKPPLGCSKSPILFHSKS